MLPPDPAATLAPALPDWAVELIALYESNAYSQFVLSGNVSDGLYLPRASLPGLDAARGPDARDPCVGTGEILSLPAFVYGILLPGFDVVLSYDLASGIRVQRGEELFATWPRLREGPLPRDPAACIPVLTEYFRYLANLGALRGRAPQVGCVVLDAHLVAPDDTGGGHALSALALGLRSWASDDALQHLGLATFLIAPNRADLHRILTDHPRAAHLEIPLPGPREIEWALAHYAERYPVALRGFEKDLGDLARRLAGIGLYPLESLLRRREHAGQPLGPADVVAQKARLVGREQSGLVSLVEPDVCLDDYTGHGAAVARLREDLALLRRGDDAALPMGYLLCGPVGTGKTFLVDCLAGEAGLPVVRLGHFRDRWVGSTEANLERIFRLLRALGRCFFFVDEADQVLGRRPAAADGGGEAGLSGRVYAMIASEMSRRSHRGRIVWILATSRPDLIEVDLKRPGRIDVRIPLFPCHSAADAFGLLRKIAARWDIGIREDAFPALVDALPRWLTAGAAESLVASLHRRLRVAPQGGDGREPRSNGFGEDPIVAALLALLDDYRPPIELSVLAEQASLALREASDLALVPEAFRTLGREG